MTADLAASLAATTDPDGVQRAHTDGWNSGDEVCRVAGVDRDQSLAVLADCAKLAYEAFLARQRDLARALGEWERIVERLHAGDVDPEGGPR